MTTALEGIAFQIAHEARASACCTSEGWASAISIPSRYINGEMEGKIHVQSYSIRSPDPDELVRIYFDGFYKKESADALVRDLRRELEPFIIGAGLVCVRETPNGLVIMKREVESFDDQIDAGVHALLSSGVDTSNLDLDRRIARKVVREILEAAVGSGLITLWAQPWRHVILSAEQAPAP